jgi:hypothetical protein
MNTDKLNDYSDVLTRLVPEMVACTPPSWNKGSLAIECDGQRLNYKLKNEEQPDKASINDTLRGLIDELYVRMDRQGDTWIQAVVDFWMEGDEVNFKTAFTYVDTKPKASARRRPWWKFGASRST